MHDVREGNFALDGLLGFDLKERTVGIVDTGRIGAVLARIMAEFGCTILAFDPRRNADCETVGVRCVPFDELLRNSGIISYGQKTDPTDAPSRRLTMIVA